MHDSFKDFNQDSYSIYPFDLTNLDDIDSFVKILIDEGADDKKKILDFFTAPQNRESLHSNLINEKLFDYMSSFAIIKDTEKSTAELRKQQ